MTATLVTTNGLSNIGPVREENQDHIRWHMPADPATAESRGLLLIVADGMGGYAKGGVASSIAAETFLKTFYGYQPFSHKKALEAAVDSANLAVHQATFRLNAGQMGTTLTVANIVGDMLYIAHVGDSRAYLIRNGQTVCLTNDHSVVGELVRMRVIKPDKVRTHAQRSILNRCLGLNLIVRPDISQTIVQEGDLIVMCSDGLWAYVEDQEFGDLAQAVIRPEANSADILAQKLVELALTRGTDDNVSVIVSRVESLGDSRGLARPALNGWRQAAAWVTQIFTKISLGSQPQA